MPGWKMVNPMTHAFELDQKKWRHHGEQLIGADMPTIKHLRQQAIDLCSIQGWPHRKQEAWKYTSTALLHKQIFDLDANAEITFTTPSANINIEPITENNFHQYENYFLAHQADSALTLLNHALWQKAFVIHMKKNASEPEPLRITYPTLQSEQTQYLKFIFILEEGATLQVIMDHHQSAGFSNLIVHTNLAPHAQITFLDYCDSKENAKQFIQHTAHLHAHSTFNHYALALQAQWLRHELTLHFNEPHAQCNMNGVYFAVLQQFIDHHLCINHKAAHCQSKQFYKGILSDAAHAVFNGKVVVAKHAEKTISSQKNHNILLSNHAEIDIKPELQIYADDVLCTHGATVGALSDDALFYLTTRGIEFNQAKKILLDAFMQEIANHCAPFEEIIKKAVTKRLTEVQWN